MAPRAVVVQEAPLDQSSVAKPRPVPTPTSRPFWDALRDERIVVQRCGACGGWVHYPRNRCSHCLSDALSFEPVSGDATVHTFTVARRPTAAPFADEVPQVISVVELAEGVRVTTTLVDVAPEDVRVGMPVRPVFDHGADGVTLLRYRPA
jgi:uncharacterized OB-fold protein